MSKLDQNVAPEVLVSLLRYDAETGKLYWLPRLPHLFGKSRLCGSESYCRKWNDRYAGKEAFTYGAPDYLRGSIFGFTTTAHRVIWALVHGEWPELQIDHINGRRHDNRIENLRQVTPAENSKNVRRRDNTSGVLGVSRHSTSGKWVAQLAIDGKNTYLGSFDTIEEAAEARRLANIKHGYHPNHGNHRKAA